MKNSCLKIFYPLTYKNRKKRFIKGIEMETHYSEAWIVATICATIACLFIFLYANLRIRHTRTCRNLKSATDSFAKQTKELETIKKQKTDLTDDFTDTTAQSIIVAFDKEGKITYVNDYAQEFFGFPKDELVGHMVLGTILPPPSQRLNAEPTLIEKILLNPQLYVDIETKNVKKDGTPVWISWTNRVVYDDKNEPVEIRSVGFDITRRKQLEEKLRYLTSIDPLTGVLNRVAFLDAGEKEIKRAIRYNRSLSLLILKLDHFRVLGQEFGYTFGDEALKKTVKICKNSIRDSDYLGRIGDVEFAILLPETPLENVQFLIERLRVKIQELNLKTEIGNAFITTSFGQSGKTDDKDSIDAMLVRATQNLKEQTQHKD